jgi:purine-nucleoside phosphorylase
MAITFESIQQAVDGLKASLPADFVPKIGIIGGSGLSALERAIEGDRHEISYERIHGFPISTGQ